MFTASQRTLAACSRRLRGAPLLATISRGQLVEFPRRVAAGSAHQCLFSTRRQRGDWNCLVARTRRAPTGSTLARLVVSSSVSCIRRGMASAQHVLEMLVGPNQQHMHTCTASARIMLRAHSHGVFPAPSLPPRLRRGREQHHTSVRPLPRPGQDAACSRPQDHDTPRAHTLLRHNAAMEGEVRPLSARLCAAIVAWLDMQTHAAAGAPFFCDKEGLNAELTNAMRAATDKKQRKELTKKFEARRQECEARMTEVAAASLPELFRSFLALHEEVTPLLKALEACCLAERAALASLCSAERAG